MSDDSDAAELTVGQAASRLGVTVRALHHWDEISLARPSARSAAGYRLYTERDLERLRRIVVYRELGVELTTIQSILDNSDTDIVTALRTQHTQLSERIERLTSLSNDIERMIDAHDQGILMSAEERTRVFGPQWNPHWPAQARQRYGDTTQWHQYAEQSASRTPADWTAIADAARGLERALADAMQAGVAPGSREADALVERHRETFSSYFPITRQMQVALGRMFDSDPAYAAHFDGIRPGLAAWLRRIIDASARTHGIDPETATWQ